MNQVGYVLTSKYLREYGARNNSDWIGPTQRLLLLPPVWKPAVQADQLNTGTCEKTWTSSKRLDGGND